MRGQYLKEVVIMACKEIGKKGGNMPMKGKMAVAVAVKAPAVKKGKKK